MSFYVGQRIHVKIGMVFDAHCIIHAATPWNTYKVAVESYRDSSEPKYMCLGLLMHDGELWWHEKRLSKIVVSDDPEEEDRGGLRYL